MEVPYGGGVRITHRAYETQMLGPCSRVSKSAGLGQGTGAQRGAGICISNMFPLDVHSPRPHSRGPAFVRGGNISMDGVQGAQPGP